MSFLARVDAFNLDLMWSTRLRSRALAKDPRRAEDDERLVAPQELCEREGRERRVQRKGVARTRVPESVIIETIPAQVVGFSPRPVQ